MKNRPYKGKYFKNLIYTINSCEAIKNKLNAKINQFNFQCVWVAMNNISTSSGLTH